MADWHTEFLAKHECVKYIHSHELICPPLYPHPSQKVVRWLCAAIELAEKPDGSGVHQKKIAELIGIPETTFSDWLCNDQLEPVKRLLSGLERLSEEKQIEFLRSFCRHCPRLEDPRISHDTEAVASIKSLIGRGPGLSLITGSSESIRTYLLTAIGNSFVTRLAVSGLDVHPPMRFVPVPGVSYPVKRIPVGALPSFLESVWSSIAARNASMILLNGIWDRVPDRHESILKLTKRNHVLIADVFETGLPFQGQRAVGIIRVEPLGANNNPTRFRIAVQHG